MTAVALHKGSASADNDALQLFDLPPTDTSMTAARMLEFTPISQGINPMEFVVPGVDAFIDLSRSYLTMKLRLKNGTDLADGELLYPANNLAHTLIKQLTCHLNGTLISPQNDSYAYKAYLKTVLNYSDKEGHTLLRPQGWFPTQHDMMTTGLDFPTPLTANKLDIATPARPLYGAQSKQESGRPLVQTRTSPLARRRRAHFGLQTAFGIVPFEQTVGARGGNQAPVHVQQS